MKENIVVLFYYCENKGQFLCVDARRKRIKANNRQNSLTANKKKTNGLICGQRDKKRVKQIRERASIIHECFA